MSATHVTRRWTAHLAILDPLVGVGVLVLPRPDEDVLDPFADGSTSSTVHEVEQDTVLYELRHLSPGFIPSEPEDTVDEWCVEGWTADGRLVVALFSTDAVVSLPAVDQEAEAMRELREAAGVVRTP